MPSNVMFWKRNMLLFCKATISDTMPLQLVYFRENLIRYK